MHIHIDKELSMQEDQIHIRIKELQENANYTLKLRLTYVMGTFGSEAVFRSDAVGVIDLERDEPIRGNYTGIRPMGLFETMQPEGDTRTGIYARCTPPPVWKFQLILTDSCGNVIETKELTKRWLHPSIERTEIKENGIRGTLFKPSGPGPFPTILDFSGTGGGLQEQKGSSLANEGFCVLTLAYFDYQDLPTDVKNVHIEYFINAIDWLTSLPYTQDHIGIQGVSFGGALVLLLATRSEKIKAVVSINGPHVMTEFAYVNENGQPLPSGKINVGADFSLTKINGLLREDKIIRDVICTDDAHYHLEKAAKDVAFRFVVSVDDMSTPAVFAANLSASVLRRSGHKVDVDMVPGGHLMEPPFFFAHPYVFSKFLDMYCAYGGEVSLHGKSQVLVWRRTVQFFKTHLGTPKHAPKTVPLSHL